MVMVSPITVMSPVSEADRRLMGEAGVSMDFTDASIAIRDLTTPANNISKIGLLFGGSANGLGEKITYAATVPVMRLQSDGTFKYQAHNLALRSEEFDHATWVKDNSGAVNPVVTANYALAPNGTLTADRIQLDKTGGTFSRIRQDLPFTIGETYVISLWMKSNTGSNANVGLRFTSTSAADANYVVTPTAQKFSIQATATATTGSLDIILWDAIAGNDETADISAWGVHLRIANSVSDYVATTSAKRCVLPLSFDANGVCRGVRTEDQRATLNAYTNTLTNAAYTATGSTASASTVGLFGKSTLLTEDSSAASAHRMFTTATIVSGSVYTYSIFVERSAGTRHIYWVVQNAGDAIYAHFDLTNGLVNNSGAGGTGALTAAVIEAYPNGVYRLSLTGSIATTSVFNQLYFEQTARTGLSAETYNGDGASGFYLAHWQIELGECVTSPIEAFSAPATRVIDNPVQTSGFPIGSGVGTLVVSGTVAPEVDGAAANYYACLSDGTTNNLAGINEGGGTFFLTLSGGALQSNFGTGAEPSAGQRVWAALSWETNSVLGCRDGVLATEDTSAVSPASLSRLSIGIRGDGVAALNGETATLECYPRKFARSELEAVTQRTGTHVVCDGNSLTAGTYQTALLALLGSTYKATHYGVGGQTTANMTTDAVAQIDVYLTAIRNFNGRAALIAWEATNDIAVDDASLATLQSRWTSYFSARASAGWNVSGNKLIAMTIIARGTFTGAQATRAADFNTWLRANYATYATHLVDLASDSRFQNSADLTYYNLDTIHLTATGYSVVADLIKAAVWP